MQRKFEDGTGAKPINHPDAPIVHHDPENKITVYHMKTKNALKTCTSGMGLCTHKDHWADGYLRGGNLFLVHHQRKRSQVFVPKNDQAWPENSGDVSKKVLQQLDPIITKIPHHKVTE